MIKDTIQWAGERGIYVIFDFYAMKNTQGKQSGQETIPWPPYNRYSDVVGSRAEYVALWKTVAQELGPLPNVILELYNEPNGDEKAKAEWFTFCQEALTAIRTCAASPVIIQWDYQCWVNLDYPPPATGSTLAWIERFPLKGTNIVYGTHLYRNSGLGAPGAIHRNKNGQVNLWEEADVRQGLELPFLACVAGMAYETTAPVDARGRVLFDPGRVRGADRLGVGLHSAPPPLPHQADYQRGLV